MPVKRRLAKGRAHKITPEAVAAYRAGDMMALHEALGLYPHEISPLDVDDGPSPYPAGCAGAVTWPQAQELKAELEAALER